MTVDRHYDWEKYSWTCSRVFLTTVGPGGPHIIAIWQVHTSPYKSIQVHTSPSCRGRTLRCAAALRRAALRALGLHAPPRARHIAAQAPPRAEMLCAVVAGQVMAAHTSPLAPTCQRAVHSPT